MQFAPCALYDLTTFEAYIAALSSPIDSFLEDHILASQFYRVIMAEQVIGAFAIHPSMLLTHFHLAGDARRFGQQVFAQALQQYSIQSALVPTCDEFFLSHALDNYSELKKQAYFFVEGENALQLNPTDLHYRLAELSDSAAIQAISGDFLDKHEIRIQNGELHVGLRDGALIAIGVIERGRLLRQQASIGMFTHEAHRGRGIGATTLRYLRGFCHAEGLIPIAGCGYDNHASKKTLEAAGMVTKTRLLRIEFGDQ